MSQTRKNSDGVDVRTKHSAILERLQLWSKSWTFYYKGDGVENIKRNDYLTNSTAKKIVDSFMEREASALTVHAFKIPQCTPDKIESAQENHLQHAKFHIKGRGYDDMHSHIIKSQMKLFTHDELQCALDNLKKFERENNLCKDGKTHCLLGDKEAKYISLAYKEYLQNQATQAKPTPTQAESIQATQVQATLLTEKITLGSKVFLHTFLTHLLEKCIAYLNEYPHHFAQGPNEEKANIIFLINTMSSICRGMELASTYLLTPSIMMSLVGYMVETILQRWLKLAGVESEKMKYLTSEINTLITFIQDPTSLIDFVLVGSADAAGKLLARLMFTALPLPKIKNGAEVAEHHQQRNNQHSSSSTSLHHRHRFKR